MVAATAARAAANTDATMLLIGAGALILFSKWGLGEVIPKLNIIPETKEFVTATIGGGRKGTYSLDQSGSPNPPSEEWWNLYSGSGEDTGWLPRQERGPIDVPIGTMVPTPPVVQQGPPTTAHLAGQATHRWFTNPKLYPWFYLADKF